jgi:16S rRNA G1207 methylase RsmC
MWNVKANVTPVIIGETRSISESLRKYLSKILGKHEIKELKKPAVLVIAHILR